MKAPSLRSWISRVFEVPSFCVMAVSDLHSPSSKSMMEAAVTRSWKEGACLDSSEGCWSLIHSALVLQYNSGPALCMSGGNLRCQAICSGDSPTAISAMQLVDEGLCSTVTRSRHVYIRGGPLRHRWCLWGREDVEPSELARVKEANTLWLNYMATCEGTFMGTSDHPAHPGEDPFPSVWCTTEMLGLERRTDAVGALLTCFSKLTCFSGTCRGLSELDGVRCPGVSCSRPCAWTFNWARPDWGLLYKTLAELVGDTLQHFLVHHQGPTGALSRAGDRPIPRTRPVSGNKGCW